LRRRVEPIRPVSITLVVLLGLAALGTGCETAPVAEGVIRWVGEPGDEPVVLAPLNLAVALPADLEESVVEPVEGEMIHYLQSRGARVAVIWKPDASWLWRESAGTAASDGSDGDDFDAVVRSFARTLSEHAAYRALVIPSLVYRHARVSGRHAHWDGVRRRIPVRSSDHRGDHTTNWDGRITALSLHALVYTPDGERIFQGWGGLDLVHDAATRPAGGGKDMAYLVPQNRLLDDPEHVQEGIAHALDGHRFVGGRGVGSRGRW